MITTLLLASSGPAVFAQKILPISGRPSCSECRIQRVHVVAFGGDERGFVGLPAGIARFEGAWVLSHADKPHSISLYSESGEFIRDIGRSGSGPGEFKFAGRMVAHADSLYVYDASYHRIQVYSRGFKVERIIELGVPLYRFAALPDGYFVVEGYSRSRQLAGYPLHLVDSQGTVVRSFGVQVAKRDPREPRAYQRVSTLAPDGTVWTGRFSEYVIEQWDIHGRKLAELRANVPWFPSDPTKFVVSPTVAPKTYMAGIWLDGTGQLWVAISVPDANWKDAVRPARPGMYNAFQVADDNRYWDTILDVIDPRTGRLIARARFDQWFSPASTDGLALTVGEDSSGAPTIHVWRPQLTPQAR